MKNVVKNNKIYFYLLGLIFIYAVFLRLDLYVFNRSFWFDEAAFAINILVMVFFVFFSVVFFMGSAIPFVVFGVDLAGGG